MADLLISRVAQGVAIVSSVDLFDSLKIYRIDRSQWQHTPEQPGIYVLYGAVGDGKLTVYIGMSATNMRNRIRSHHVNPAKNWFGVLFAVPVSSALLCPAIEAELIGEVTEAGAVDVIANIATENRHRGADDVHVEPAVQKIRESLQLLLGSDIFTPTEIVGPESTDAPIARMPALAREHRGQAATPRQRDADDPPLATHGYVGAGAAGWGQFEGDDPDKRFRVFAGSGWRRLVLNPELTKHDANVKGQELQDELVTSGVLDSARMTFARDHVFENWGVSTRVVSGMAQYSGAYHWQPIEDEPAEDATPP